MNRIMVWTIILSFMISVPVVAATYSVQSVNGPVDVRHGVAEVWVALKAGEKLKPDDSIRTGKGASAVITIDGGRKVYVPEFSIVEVIDLRSIDQNELILKLTMEFIRGMPSDRRDSGLETPSTTIVHGTDRSRASTSVGETPSGQMQINGARVLFDHAFFGSCVLRAKGIFRVYPDLKKEFGSRIMVPTALEKLELEREALNEYMALSNESFSAEQRALVQKNIERLKKRLQEG